MCPVKCEWHRFIPANYPSLPKKHQGAMNVHCFQIRFNERTQRCFSNGCSHQSSDSARVANRGMNQLCNSVRLMDLQIHDFARAIISIRLNHYHGVPIRIGIAIKIADHKRHRSANGDHWLGFLGLMPIKALYLDIFFLLWPCKR